MFKKRRGLRLNFADLKRFERSLKRDLESVLPNFAWHLTPPLDDSQSPQPAEGQIAEPLNYKGILLGWLWGTPPKGFTISAEIRQMLAPI
ncbi:MAG: hypothetical protein ACRCTY_07315, partial [Candidatus Adiutrix sp.]